MKGGKAAILTAAAAAAAVTGTTDTSGGTVDTTTTTTTEATSTPTTSTSTTTTTTTTSTPSFQVPANYVVKSAASFGVKCDGVTDDTVALQSALNKIAAFQALQLPAGTCVTSSVVQLYNKQDVIVFGAGRDLTTIRATDPARSAFVITASSRVGVNGFTVSSPNATARLAAGPARGFYVERSQSVTISGVRVNKVAAAGIVMWRSTDSTISDSRVDGSLADGFHITGASQNIVVKNNVATGNGDDCFASIGYGTTLNVNISFLNNRCSDNRAAGVSFEGTTGGRAYGNTLTRTGEAGIRIASKSSWNTGAVSDIEVTANLLDRVRTRTDLDSTGIFILTSLNSISNVRFSQNKIVDGNIVRGRRMLNYVPGTATISNVTFDGETDTSATGMETVCLVVSTGVSGYANTASSLNNQSCRPA